jgi:hypothetical protein
MKYVRALMALTAASIAAPALAADAPTVQALLADGYAVVAAIPTQIGPGLFLQKGDNLFACFVSETPESPDLKTNYCKPVH